MKSTKEMSRFNIILNLMFFFYLVYVLNNWQQHLMYLPSSAHAKHRFPLIFQKMYKKFDCSSFIRLHTFKTMTSCEVGRNKGMQTSRKAKASAVLLEAVNRNCGCNCFVAGCTQRRWVTSAIFLMPRLTAPCGELTSEQNKKHGSVHSIDSGVTVKDKLNTRSEEWSKAQRRQGCREVNSFPVTE